MSKFYEVIRGMGESVLHPRAREAILKAYKSDVEELCQSQREPPRDYFEQIVQIANRDRGEDDWIRDFWRTLDENRNYRPNATEQRDFVEGGLSAVLSTCSYFNRVSRTSITFGQAMAFLSHYSGFTPDGLRNFIRHIRNLR